MYDPRVVDTFFAVQGTEDATTAAPPVPAVRHSALQAPLRIGDDRRDLDLQTFFDLGRALTGHTSMPELGESGVAASAVADAGLDLRPLRVRSGRRFDRRRLRGRRSTTARCARPRIRLGERVSGWVAATGQMVVNSDARLDLDEDARDRSPLRSALVGADRVDTADRSRCSVSTRARPTRSTMRTGNWWRRRRAALARATCRGNRRPGRSCRRLETAHACRASETALTTRSRTEFRRVLFAAVPILH